MGDMGDYWRDVVPEMKQRSIEKRASNRQKSADMLMSIGIEFDSKNDGAHLIVKGNGVIVDFWPGTGKYIPRGGKAGRGVFNLIRLIRGA